MNYLAKILKSLILLICSSNIWALSDVNTSPNKFESFYAHFTNISTNNSLVFPVSNFILKKDIGTFYLKSGQVHFCNAFEDRIFSAVFIGDGEFKFTPPNKIEKDQLYRYSETYQVDEKFEKLFLLFSDSTFFELIKDNKSVTTIHSDEASKFASESVEYFMEEDFKYIDSDFTKTILDEKYNTYFSAQFETLNNGGFLEAEDLLFFTINPFNIEDVSLSIGKSRLGHYWKKVINKFKSPDHERIVDYENFEKKEIDITNYSIESNIDVGLDFSAKVIIDFSCLTQKQKWIYFSLYEELEVDSIIWANGNYANFTREDDGWQIWVELDSNSNKANVLQSLTIYYNGDLLERMEHFWIHLRSISYWYPRYAQQKSRYNLKYIFPSKLKIASVGEKKSTDIYEDQETSNWVTNEKIKSASFSIGSYKEHNLENEESKNIYIYQAKGNKSQYGFDRGMDEEVGIDIGNSLRFYENLFGPPNFENLYVCEHPYNHGQAFPGFINLSWSTFAGTDIHGEDEMFRAHEVAHQWWGIGVGYKSYHDQWLSEGFSTYSGLMYLALISEDSDKFFDILDDWKERIMNNRKYLFGSGQEAGPIWLGNRTESEETEGDYSLIIYKKGAWILHMLRNMMIDLKTMNEDLFNNMIKDYYSTFNGKEATTEDFIGICSKHFGIDMNWFFHQWIFGTEVPEYKFAYDYNKTPENKYLVTCRTEQSEVPSNFIAYVPLLIKFDNDRHVRLRVKVTGAKSEFNLPLLPLEPEEIIFNDLNSVLCDFEYVDWDEL
jgi:Peptidase family M1 domain